MPDKDTHMTLPVINPDAGGTGGNGGDAGKQDTRTFTQAELDTLFADRARRAAETATADLLTKAGLKSADDLLALLAEGKKLKDGQMSELEKLQADLKAANEKAEKAATDGTLALSKATERLLKAAVLAEATAQGFLPEAVNDVWLHVDRAKITEKDDEFKGIKEAVAEVAKARPFWVAGATTPPRGSPRTDGKRPPSTDTKQPPARPLVRF